MKFIKKIALFLAIVAIQSVECSNDDVTTVDNDASSAKHQLFTITLNPLNNTPTTETLQQTVDRLIKNSYISPEMQFPIYALFNADANKIANLEALAAYDFPTIAQILTKEKV